MKGSRQITYIAFALEWQHELLFTHLKFKRSIYTCLFFSFYTQPQSLFNTFLCHKALYTLRATTHRLFIFYFFCFFIIPHLWSGHDNPEITKTPIETPLEGKKYMKFCDGGFSKELQPIEDESCIADYPGMFASKAFFAIFSIFFGLVSIFSFIVYVGIYGYFRYQRA